MATLPVPPHRSAGVRALVALHERELRAFLPVWERARAAGIVFPTTSDPAYASYGALLFHVLGAARGYLVWICASLEIADPEVNPTPPADRIEGKAKEQLEHLADRWRVALAEVPDERLEDRGYASRWGPSYTIDAMLEHAVMHPIRHRYQLENLLAAAGRGS